MQLKCLKGCTLFIYRELKKKEGRKSRKNSPIRWGLLAGYSAIYHTLRMYLLCQLSKHKQNIIYCFSSFTSGCYNWIFYQKKKKGNSFKSPRSLQKYFISKNFKWISRKKTFRNYTVLTYLVFLILPGIRKTRNYSSHSGGWCNLASIDHDEQFH